MIDVFRSQFHAALDMLERAVDACPAALWNDPTPKNRFWHVAYHALFYTHLYLQDSEGAFRPWVKHREDYAFLGPLPWPPHREPRIGEPYTREEVLEYLAICRQEVDRRLPATDFDAPSGFPWLSFGKRELQIYSIRHIQHHAGQLIDRLRAAQGIAVDWVGAKRLPPHA